MILEAAPEAAEEEEVEVKPFEYFEQIMVTKIQHFYLSGCIDGPTSYVSMIHKIHVAGPDETIIIHLNTQGGDLGTGLQLINAMKSSNGHIVCSLEGEAYSLGSLIFLAADEFLVHDNSIMMIHNFSGGGMGGKGNEQQQQLAATIKWFNLLSHDYYIPFLSEKELKDILKGGDLWLQATDIRKRIIKMINTQKKAIADQAKK